MSESSSKVEKIYDIRYTSALEYATNRKVYRNPDKYCLDLYLPRQNAETFNACNIAGIIQQQLETNSECLLSNEEEGYPSTVLPPIVVFIHGGAWWSGDRRAWRLFHYYDFNPIMATVSYFMNRTYCNVGNAFAKKGVACAVISYPLTITNVEWPALLWMACASFISSTLFLGIIAAVIVFILWIICMIAQTTLHEAVPLNYIGQFMFYKGFRTKSFTSWLGLLAFFQLVILVTKLCHPINRKPRIQIPVAILIGCACIAYIIKGAIFNIYIPRVGPGILVDSCIILLNYMLGVYWQSYHLPKVDIRDQLEAISKVITWVEEYGRETHRFDPTKLVVMAYSAGAQLLSSALLRHDILSLQQKQSIKGLIAMSGVYDMDYIGNLGISKHLILYPAFGKHQQGWQKYSPQHMLEQYQGQIDTFFPPSLLFYADREVTKIDSQTLNFRNTLHRHGVPCKQRLVPSLGHFEVINFFGWKHKLSKKKNDTMEDLAVDFVHNCTTKAGCDTIL